jgi:hypothetical protein
MYFQDVPFSLNLLSNGEKVAYGAMLGQSIAAIPLRQSCPVKDGSVPELLPLMNRSCGAIQILLSDRQKKSQPES